MKGGSTVVILGLSIGMMIGIIAGPSMATVVTDSDGDGMDDAWEIRVGLNPNVDDADNDPDGDGLSNREEFLAGSHPFMTDSDGDGLDDRAEVRRYGTDPGSADSDGGGQPDGFEISNNRNPLIPEDDLTPKRAAVPLTQDKTLISLPFTPASVRVADVIAPVRNQLERIWGKADDWDMYDPALVPLSDLTEMVPGKGYWVYMKAPAVLHVAGEIPAKTVSLKAGWNLVGYSAAYAQAADVALASIRESCEVVWSYRGNGWRSYNPVMPQLSDLKTLEPGRGYWIKMRTDGVWSLP